MTRQSPRRTFARFNRDIERLEDHLAPAGLINVTVSGSTLNLASVPAQDGDEVVTIARQADGTYLLTPGATTVLRIGGVDKPAGQAEAVDALITGMQAKLGLGSDQVTLDQAKFGKSVAIDLGNGNNSFTMNNSAIAGNLTLTAKEGNDTATFGGSSSDVDSVAGKFTANLGDGTNLVHTNLTRVAFGGVQINGGAGSDTFQATGNDVRFSTLKGGFAFNGGGVNTVNLGDGSAQITNSGPVKISGATSAGTTVTIGGAQFDAASLQLNLGNQTNSLISSATSFNTTGSVRWTSGNGDDTIKFTGNSARIGGTFNVNGGDGIADFQITTTFIDIGAAVSIKNGNTPGGPSSISFIANDAMVVGGSVSITSGTGETAVDVFANSDLMLGGNVNLRQGAGAGLVRVASNGKLVATGSISIQRPDALGVSEVFGGLGGDPVIHGSVTIKGGGMLEVLMGGVIGGSLTMTGAPGTAPEVIIQTNSDKLVQVNGPVRIATSAQTGQLSSIFLTGLIAQSALTINTGAGNETLNFDNCALLSTVTASLGAGADKFNVETSGFVGGSTFFGPAVFNGGAGADTFLLAGNNAATEAVTFKNSVTINGGVDNDADTVTQGTQLTLDPSHPLKLLNIP